MAREGATRQTGVVARAARETSENPQGSTQTASAELIGRGASCLVSTTNGTTGED
jgi:hypothetical protein